MTELLSQSLAEIAKALDAGTVTASALVETAIANHDRWGERLHAYSLWLPDEARLAARAADAAFAAGARVGLLQGIPISAKDLFGLEGAPTFAGSKRRLPPEWEREGPLVASLRRQLGVFMGKTHMVEFAFGGTGANAHWGAPRNPWSIDPPRSPGGSSSGAGVSLLEGSALVALGSDTAGSVRIPASATGNVGLKVTLGRWSTAGLVPLSRTFDTPGLLVRSAGDAAFCFAAVDPTLGNAGGFLAALERVTVDGLRIGVGEPTFWQDCEPGIAEAATAALAQLERAGARLVEKRLPQAEAANAVFREGGVSGIELRAFLDRELPAWLSELDPINAPIVAATSSVPAPVYAARRDRLAALAAAAAGEFSDVDVIASPTLAITPPAMTEIRDSDSHWRANRALTRNTCPVNYLGLCAVTLPVGLDRAGMPVGLQLIAKGGAEEGLLMAAVAAERVLGTARERLGIPPLLR